MAKKKSKFLRRLPLVGIFLLLVVGLCMFMYPIVGEWYTEYTARTEISAYNDAVQKAGNSALMEMEKQAISYNAALAANKTEEISSINYDSLMAVANSMGYIEIPKIGVYLPIYKGLSDVVLRKGVGHMEGSSLPIGGESTHCVLAGHTGLPSAKMFTDLDLLHIGDAFYVHVLNKVMKYEIDQIITVLPNEMNAVSIVEGEDYVTLVTCTPYGINSHRLLVRGKRVPYETKTMETEPFWPVINPTEEQVPVRTIAWHGGAWLFGAVLVIVILILIFPSRKKRRKDKKVGDHTDNHSE